jgi:hypothetical protein
MDLTRLYGMNTKLLIENFDDEDWAKISKKSKVPVSELKKELSSGLYAIDENTLMLEASGELSTSDHVNSYVKTAVDLGLGYGIGKAMSLDTKDSDGAVVATAVVAQIIGHLIDYRITRPYITKPTHKLLPTHYNFLDYAYVFMNAYHGYIRNNESLAYGTTWGLSSLFVGAELTGAAMAQGFGKKVGK